jgi:hypothetical protein
MTNIKKLLQKLNSQPWTQALQLHLPTRPPMHLGSPAAGARLFPVGPPHSACLYCVCVCEWRYLILLCVFKKRRKKSIHNEMPKKIKIKTKINNLLIIYFIIKFNNKNKINNLIMKLKIKIK